MTTTERSEDGPRYADKGLLAEEEVWLRAWLVVAACFNAKLPDCTRYADACLEQFRDRFRKYSA